MISVPHFVHTLQNTAPFRVSQFALCLVPRRGVISIVYTVLSAELVFLIHVWWQITDFICLFVCQQQKTVFLQENSQVTHLENGRHALAFDKKIFRDTIYILITYQNQDNRLIPSQKLYQIGSSETTTFSFPLSFLPSTSFLLKIFPLLFPVSF